MEQHGLPITLAEVQGNSKSKTFSKSQLTPHARHNISSNQTVFMSVMKGCCNASKNVQWLKQEPGMFHLKFMVFIALIYHRRRPQGECFSSEKWDNISFISTLSRNWFLHLIRRGSDHVHRWQVSAHYLSLEEIHTELHSMLQTRVRYHRGQTAALD